MVISFNMYDMICIQNFTYVPALYKTFAVAALVLMTRIFYIQSYKSYMSYDLEKNDHIILILDLIDKSTNEHLGLLL